MFGDRHYVPLLRSKLAELRALNALPPEVRHPITPVVEFLPRTFTDCSSRADTENKLDELAEHFTSWKNQRIILDFSPLNWDYHRQRATGPHPVIGLFERLLRTGVWPVPLVTLKMAATSILAQSVSELTRRHSMGISLRVSPAELSLSDGALPMIGRCLDRFRQPVANVDLILDRCAIERSSIPFSELAPLIPWLDDWGSLTVLAGSFPADLSHLEKGRIHHLRRHEWAHWEAIRGLWRGRRPAFGDYTIQHVYFKEPVAFANFSASVRYTLNDHVMVMRGEGVQNPDGPGYAQWNGWAKYLLSLPDYFGRDFSAGDAYAAERALNGASTGTAQSWLQAAFSHHLTVASWQVRGLLEVARPRHRVQPAAPSISVPGQPDLQR